MSFVDLEVARNGILVGVGRLDEAFRLTGVELPAEVQAAVERDIEGAVRFCVDGERLTGGVHVGGIRWTWLIDDGGPEWCGVWTEDGVGQYRRCWRADDPNDSQEMRRTVDLLASCAAGKVMVGTFSTWAAARMCSPVDPVRVPDRGPWGPGQ